MYFLLMGDLNNLLSVWMTNLESIKGYSVHTLKAYRSDVEDLISFLQYDKGDAILPEDLLKIDLSLLRNWLIHRKKDNKSSISSARAVASIKNFFQFLVTKKYPINTSVFKLKTPKKKVLGARLLCLDDILKCIKMISGGNQSWIEKRNLALLILLYTSGMRIGEALSIKQKQVGNHFGQIKILGKGGKERIIPLLDITKSHLAAYIQSIPNHFKWDDNYLFLGKRGKILAHSVFTKCLHQLKNTLGITSSITAHKFRHSYASHLLANGACLRHVQELLGHSNLSSTQRYTQIDIEGLKKVHQLHPIDNVDL